MRVLYFFLAMTAALALPASALAQKGGGGGGRGGGGGGGGQRGGGGGGGAHRGGGGGAHHGGGGHHHGGGGHHHGGGGHHHGGHHHHNGGSNWWLGIGLGGYPWGGYGYGYGYPRYGYGYGYPGYSSYAPYYDDYGYSSSSYPSTVVVPRSSLYYEPSVRPAAPAISSSQAFVEVILPDPDAEVLVQDQVTSKKGTHRTFYSPELADGKTYTYTITMRSGINGRARDVTKQVDVRAGSRVVVDFTKVTATPRAPEPRGD